VSLRAAVAAADAAADDAAAPARLPVLIIRCAVATDFLTAAFTDLMFH